jgi:hypothetical protein
MFNADAFLKQWASRRIKHSIKLDNYAFLEQFCKELARLNVPVNHLDDAKYKSKLWFNEGSPLFCNFIVSKEGKLVYKDFKTTCWLSYPEKDLSVFKTANKYKQTSMQVNINQPYNLFLLQLAATRDLKETLDALYWATHNKVYTVFKAHPCPGDGSNYDALWALFKSKGLISDYTVLVSDANIDHLIDNANIVYSADSAGSFNALLANKQVATYRAFPGTSIVPRISTSKDLSAIPTIGEKDKNSFLSWYFYNLPVCVTQEGWQDKLRYIVRGFTSGKTFDEVYTYGYL